MAVTLTAQALATAIGKKLPVAERLLPVSSALVERYAPLAPDAIQNEAVIRCSGWLSNQPASACAREQISFGGGALSQVAVFRPSTGALRGSGAMGLLSTFKVRRGGLISGSGVQVPQTSSGLPPGSNVNNRLRFSGGKWTAVNRDSSGWNMLTRTASLATMATALHDAVAAAGQRQYDVLFGPADAWAYLSTPQFSTFETAEVKRMTDGMDYPYFWQISPHSSGLIEYLRVQTTDGDSDLETDWSFRSLSIDDVLFDTSVVRLTGPGSWWSVFVGPGTDVFVRVT